MKKIIFIMAAAALLACFTACSKKNKVSKSEGKIKVVATIFPVYDWSKNICHGSDNIELELLVKNGVDLHSYQPSAGDIIKISTADVIIFAGGESDAWVKDAVRNSSNKNQIVLNLIEKLGDSVKSEQIVEGMQKEEEEEAEEEKDEHIWLSLVNAKLCSQEIAEAVSSKDETNRQLYYKNLDSYIEQIDSVWASCVSKDRKMIVVCDRFPFRYMTDELGILYYAAFPGCSAETEASFETVAFLSGKIKEMGLNKVYVTESSDKKMAHTVMENAGLSEKDCRILVLDSMQSTTLEQADNGKNYIDVMKKNFSLVAEANR